MTAATIEIDDYEILAALTQLARNVDHLEPALDAIGDTVKAGILLNFREQHDPDGEPWEPLSPATLEQRRDPNRNSANRNNPKPTKTGAQILRDTGLLNRSISYETSAFAVEIGSDKVYANMMQFGGKKSDYPWLWGDIPERKFAGVSEADRGQILDILGHHLELSSR